MDAVNHEILKPTPVTDPITAARLRAIESMWNTGTLSPTSHRITQAQAHINELANEIRRLGGSVSCELCGATCCASCSYCHGCKGYLCAGCDDDDHHCTDKIERGGRD